MLFNSLEFLLFFPVAIAAHYTVPASMQRHVLLWGSLFFYGWYAPIYLLLLIGIILIDFAAGLAKSRPSIP